MLKKNLYKLIFALLVVSFVHVQVICTFAESDNNEFDNNVKIEDSENKNLTIVTRSPHLYEEECNYNTEESQEVNSETVADFNELGLNKINIDEISKYVKVKKIDEEQFYDINFNMEILNVALTKSNDLLIRTKNNTYYAIKMSQKYINALELTGVLNVGSSKAINEDKIDSKRSTSIFIIFSLIISFSFFVLWFFFINKKILKKDKLIVNEKNNTKKPETNTEKNVTFDKVQGIDELKPDLLRLVDILKFPYKYKKLGARPTKGLILYGPPGTGKTLIAKAISGEAGVPFFSASGSDFVEKYVGVGASRIRDLFNKAKKVTPCIVFIDEIDAIGGNRGEGNNSERDQTINALLTELDGFSAAEGILTICATNRLDLLDSALTRPGRFDLKLAVNLPDKQARHQILKLHSADKKLSPKIDIEGLAKKTNGFSGAELENLLNESALISATKGKESITKSDLEEAFFKLIMNGNRKERLKDDNDYSKLVAYHEAGHTLATKLLTKDSVPTVTIVQSTSGAGGVTFRAPEDVPLKSKKYLKSLIKVMYAGRAAEEILLDSDEDITTGASQDIKQATEIIKQYIGIYGMGDKGMIDITQLTNQFNIVEEAACLANDLYKDTIEFLVKHRKKLDCIAKELMEKETLDEMRIDTIISEN
ncbi:ATP-dependent metallopeptidase FtsH/Yme1/Tma family protein [Anaerovorax odorimutans]|uniref:ATP-dependent metallopeptidase FtsH/Yme1/Tma family protein n=1 Tax=Anaerovorax odorimutans TaxID=109327 RepID=UPI000406533B|nr:AAA family ATPase [Anaerovorax odorimutans]